MIAHKNRSHPYPEYMNLSPFDVSLIHLPRLLVNEEMEKESHPDKKRFSI
jgi:hypothetical protein